MSSSPPKVFVSYSHDSDLHKNWVQKLATRLVGNGVNVLLDQWDLTLGSDLPRFMESGLTAADRVLSICSDLYVAKANAGLGGVGYEKMILTAQLMQKVTTDRVIPVIRANTLGQPVPIFLSSRVFIDFRDDLAHEEKYAELLGDIYGHGVRPRPPLGVSPFLSAPTWASPRVSLGSGRFVSPSLSGTVVFDYSNNNGRYVVGAGDMAFETAWSGGNDTSMHSYAAAPSIRSLALAVGATSITEIVDASTYDTSSTSRTPELGEIVVWENTAGYYLATKVDRIRRRRDGFPADELTFSYAIAPNKALSFAHST